MSKEIISFIKEIYRGWRDVNLHAPIFVGNEIAYLTKCIETTMVSSVGQFVDQFERDLASFTGASGSVAVVNGTAALHTALILTGVKPGDEVLTQSLTFVATANAISYTGAKPVFIDVSEDRLSLCSVKLEAFLNKCKIDSEGNCRNPQTGNIIRACVPMHTFGHAADMDAIVRICHSKNIKVIEDAAESLGTRYNGVHTGLIGDIGVLSFNGNKIITSGGGGALISTDGDILKKAKHLTTTAKKAHAWKYEHDVIGYNYRMPNINAALACAQLECINDFLKDKRTIAEQYRAYFATIPDIKFFDEPLGSKSNFWLNSIIFSSERDQQRFLEESNASGVITRPIWVPMHKLDMYSKCERTEMAVTDALSSRIVNIPSGVRS